MLLIAVIYEFGPEEISGGEKETYK